LDLLQNHLKNKNSFLLKKLVLAYLLFLSFTSAFSISWAISLPVILCTSISFLYLVNIKNEYIFSRTDFFLFCFLVSVFISFLLNSPNFRSNKPINHLIAYSFSTLCYYYIGRNAFYKFIKKEGVELLLKFLSFGVLLSSVYCIIEFTLANFFDFAIDLYVPRVEIQDYSPTIGSIIRARSFVEESGHYAFFLESLGGIAIYYFRNIIKNKIFGIIASVMIIISFLLCFSVAGYIAIFLGFLLSGLTGKFSPLKIIYTVITLLFLIFVLDYLMDIYIGQGVIQNVVNRLTNSSSGEEREGRALSAIYIIKSADIKNIMFGFGPAAYDTMRIDPILSLYLLLFFELGLFGTTFFILFLISVYFYSKKKRVFIDPTYRRYLNFSLIAVLVHFFAIHNYFYPWFWVLLIYYQMGLGSKFKVVK
jgi:hypothetical protein